MEAHNVIALVLIGATVAGLGILFGLLIHGMIADRRHQKWTEENNKRRHNVK